MILFFLFVIVPVVMAIALSFTYYNMIEIPQWRGIDNYLKMFLDDNIFGTAFVNTLKFAIITGPVGYMLSFIIAWLINELTPKVRSVVTLIFYTPALTSSLGLFLMKQFMEQVPGALIEAAKIDGASHFTIYWKIVMPLVKPAWLTLLLYAFQGIWATSSGSTVYNEEFKLLPNAISQVLSGTIERTGASAAGNVLLMIPPILVFILTQSNVIQTMTSSGIKE